MRFCLLVFTLLILPALPAQAQWDRLRPEATLPPRLPPASAAACEEKARNLDGRVRQAEAAAAAHGGATEDRLPQDFWAERWWFSRRCFWPRLCPAAAAPPWPLLRGLAVTAPYERLIRLCGRQDGQQ